MGSQAANRAHRGEVKSPRPLGQAWAPSPPPPDPGHFGQKTPGEGAGKKRDTFRKCLQGVHSPSARHCGGAVCHRWPSKPLRRLHCGPSVTDNVLTSAGACVLPGFQSWDRAHLSFLPFFLPHLPLFFSFQLLPDSLEKIAFLTMKVTG